MLSGCFIRGEKVRSLISRQLLSIPLSSSVLPLESSLCFDSISLLIKADGHEMEAFM